MHVFVLFESIIYSADLQDVRELLLVSSSAGHITRRRRRARAARGSEFLDADGSTYQRGHCAHSNESEHTGAQTTG